MSINIVLTALSRELKIPIETIDPDINLKDLPDLDSLRLIRVISSVEEELGFGVDDDQLYTARTVRELAEMFALQPVGDHEAVHGKEA